MTTNDLAVCTVRSRDLYTNAVSRVQFKLTLDQKTALSQLCDFITEVSREEIAILQGYAGTGKSCVMGALIKAMTDSDISVICLAPTGKASKVLSQYSGQQACTIHHAVFEISEITEKQTRFCRRHGTEVNTVFVIDEASMISDQVVGAGDVVFGTESLLTEMLNYIDDGTENKVILVGDPAQLPPVKSQACAALDAHYLSERYQKRVMTVELTTVVRQIHDSGICDLAREIRNAIEYPGMKKFITIPNTDDVHITPAGEFPDLYFHALETVGTKGTTILAHRNKTVSNRNSEARQILGQRTALQVNEPLAVINNNYLWREDGQIDYLANGDIVTVDETGPEETLGRFRFKLAAVSATGFAGQTVKLSGLLLLNSLIEPGFSFTNRDRAELYRVILSDYYGLRGAEQRDAVISDPRFQCLLIRYAYAMTVHRSQGSQWPFVFLDLSDWAWFCRIDPQTALRWLYTAVTRAKTNLHLVGLPKDARVIPLAL